MAAAIAQSTGMRAAIPKKKMKKRLKPSIGGLLRSRARSIRKRSNLKSCLGCHPNLAVSGLFSRGIATGVSGEGCFLCQVQ
jgi:hypothetical protein